MIKILLSGGLGNQMFQYAFGKYLAEKNNTSLSLSLSYIQSKLPFKSLATPMQFELDVFNIDTQLEQNFFQSKYLYPLAKTEHFIRQFINKKKLNVVNEQQFEFNEDFLGINDNSFLIGNFQSENYFIPIQHKIRNDFSFIIPLDSDNISWKTKIVSCNSVSVHIRRGDYISLQQNASKFAHLSLDYYKRAIEYISNKIENPVFFIFSDDMDWVRQHLDIAFETHYITHNIGKYSYRDMQLMSFCKHHIIANSTFSWWGAWLNGAEHKIVVAPEMWFIDKSINSKDIIPSDWIKL